MGQESYLERAIQATLIRNWTIQSGNLDISQCDVHLHCGMLGERTRKSDSSSGVSDQQSVGSSPGGVFHVMIGSQYGKQ